jgi:hypothetical protein
MKAIYSWLLVSAFFLCFFTPAKAAAQDRQGQTFTCESRHNRFQSCRIPDPHSEIVREQLMGHGAFAARPGAMTPMESGG